MKQRLLFTLALILSTTFLTLQAQDWNEIINANAADGAAGDLFGRSVSISGDTAIVGFIDDDDDDDDDAGVNSGSAYVFVRSGTIWIEQAKLTASDAAAGDKFGFNLGISGNTAIIGSLFDDDLGTDSGSAYFFEQNLAITPDIAALPDITEQCQSTPAAPTANRGALTGTPDVAFPIISQGTTVVIWTYDDGNTTDTQTQNIIIADTTPPTITCAADVSFCLCR